MNVSEFAEQVVFGKSLTDKLTAPDSISFESQSSGSKQWHSIRSPGRPVDLPMQLDNRGNVRPNDQILENEYARGQLLHFLANHELLATELMALVLLKFPDAPKAFRQGVFATLLEEQEHTRMYMRRMKECGVEFGAFPVSGQFWRMVEPMQSPMDFVARLSLTFEQANLDYSRHFATVFRRIEDHATADVLQKIYEDEIGHVRHGLHWFQQWKEPGESDWQAYQDRLQLPMSPVRGRGPGVAFNREGRLQAGLSPEFVDAIEVFGQSKGRAVTVRWFDPAVESSLAGEPPEKNSALMNQLARDLECVMLAVSKSDDILLVNHVPSQRLRKHWVDSGLTLPEFVPFNDRESLLDRKLHDLAPWAWTASSGKIAETLEPAVRHAPSRWRPARVDLYRKSWSTERLADWLKDGHEDLPNWFATGDSVGNPVFDRNQLECELNSIAKLGYSHAIFKRDLATSGRGQRRLVCGEPLSADDDRWLNFIFGERGGAEDRLSPVGVVEPELNRIVDLSFLWHWADNENEPRFLGWTRPLVAKGRRYIGTRLGNEFADCEETIRQFLLENRCDRIRKTADWLQLRLTEEFRSRFHTGYFGVDAMLLKNREQKLEIKPLVELNPRMTMGHIALGLKSRLANGMEAEFRILTANEWQKLGVKLEQLKVEQYRDGRWKSGILMLSDPNESSKLIPTFLIGRETCERI